MWPSDTGELFQTLYAITKKEYVAKRFDHCLELEAKARRVQHDRKEIDELTATRLSRQEILRRDNPPDFWWIIGEAAPRQAVGGPAVMREQLTALLPVVYTEITTIQVVPFSAGACALTSGALILLTLPDGSTTVHQEGLGPARSSTTRNLSGKSAAVR
ncbi:DUF5753 domain-containing protein [Streptomyces niveiscabiei]|uniref:DUF5753 domain-containing protein n=1 Tax=Streptomyces niveiscabiei TaxID=164115 RepID=UPI0029A1F638|nr:DUF5753 domain-containing protein [Streptomyces niveiscabiei]MDX3387306.1 DUF5753 domain-containing protein [Streptomyces niveiscabiei]